MGEGVLYGVGLKVDPSGVESGVARATSSLNGFDSIAKKIGGALAAYFTFSAIKGAALNIHEAADALELHRARVEGMVRATDAAAGVSAQHIEELAKRTAATSLNTGNQVREASATLLSFRNITAPIFDQTIRLSADMAAALGEDLTGAVWTLGRALEDPTRGMMMLRRQGIALSQDEQRAVKTAMDHNDVLAAQKVILNAVEERFHGLAAELHGTTIGAIHDAQVAWEEFKQALGGSDAAESIVGRIATALKDAALALRYVLAPTLAEKISQADERIAGLRTKIRTTGDIRDTDMGALTPATVARRMDQTRQLREQLAIEMAVRTDLVGQERDLFRAGRRPTDRKTYDANVARFTAAARVAPGATPTREQRYAQEQLEILREVGSATVGGEGKARPPVKSSTVGTGETPEERAAKARLAIAGYLADQMKWEDRIGEAEARRVVDLAREGGLGRDEVKILADRARGEAELTAKHEKDADVQRDAMQQYEEGQRGLVEAAAEYQRTRFAKLVEQSNKQSETISALYRRAMENSQDAVAQFFDDAMAGNVKSFKDLAAAVLAIWRQLVAQMLAEKALGNLFRSLGFSVGAGADSIGKTPPISTQHAGVSALSMPSAPMMAASGTASGVGRAPAGDVYHVSVSFAPSFIDASQGDAWLRARGPVIRDEVAKGVRASRAYKSALAGS